MKLSFCTSCYVALLCILKGNPACGAKILGFLSTISRSHFVVEEPVLRELAKRGHEVTIVTSFKQSGEPLINYRYIEIPDFLNISAFERFKSGATNGNSFIVQDVLTLVEPLTKISINMMNHPKFLPLKNESFDLLIIGWYFNEYALGLSSHFRCPSVVISPNANFYSIRKLSGNPSSASTIASLFVNFDSPMTFLERLMNVGAYIIEYIISEFIFYFYIKPLYLEAFPPDKYPSFEDVQRNVSLVLLAQHFSARTPEALLPNVIEAEGMHINKEPSPLPNVRVIRQLDCRKYKMLACTFSKCKMINDIKLFLDSATNGAIYFSFGTLAKSSDLSPEKITIFINTFLKFKHKILWKFENDLPNLPDNVKIGKWLPQNDILAHPNVKLFISHCGKGGITEAKYHGVPILAIPLFAEQFGNADRIVSEGWAVKLTMDKLREETFSNALNEALNNPTYSQAAMRLSKLNRDRPEHPLDKAIFWIEYVIRHNGAKHMQSPAIHLNLLQYYVIDVYAFILIVLWLAVKMLKILSNIFLRNLLGLGRNKVKNE